jgi:Zn-finger domain-containing protein
MIAVMAAPRSEIEASYRREIAAYLALVMETKGWKQPALGKAAGYSDHTMVNKALKLKHTLSYDAVLTLEANSGVSIPETLTQAAIDARQATTAAVTKDKSIARILREVQEVMRHLSQSEREKLIRDLLD